MTAYCRLCTSLKENNDVFNILDPVHQITYKVLKWCKINLQEFDYLPQNCCYACLDTLNRFIEFTNKCSAAQETLKQAFNIKIEQIFLEIVDDTVANPKVMSAGTQVLVETSLVEQETVIDDSQPTKCEKLSKRKSKSPVKKQIVYPEHENSPFKEEHDISTCTTEEEWLICEAPIGTETTEDEEIEENVVDENGSLNNDEFNNDIPNNTTVEVTVESSSPLIIFPDDCYKNADGSINEEGLAKLNFDSWNNYPWSCVECQMQCSSVTELREHFKSHKQTIKYHCTDCNKICIKYLTFLNHVRRRHRPHLNLCCDICSKFFWDGKLYRKHRITHGDNDLTQSCTICQKTFRTSRSLHAHVKTHLPADGRDSSYCKICDKSFDLRASLLIHMRIHTGIKNFTCDQCGKSFIQKGNLESHLITHTRLQPFSCPTCKKAFKTQMRLNNHMSVHSGLKPHKCDICGRQFREKGTLREHLRIHTGDMPFTCEFCNKRFRFKGILTTHRRQHTGERPYSCLQCNHHFTNWPNFNKHMKRRHGINTSVSTRRPQTIPPSGMPPQSKLNFVVPTLENNIELDDIEELDEEDAIPSTFYVSDDVDEAISDMQQIIEEQELQVECNETPSLESYITTEMPALSFYNM